MSRPCESAFLLEISPTEADTLSAGVVQNFDSVAVEDGDNRAGEVSERANWEEQEQKGADPELSHQSRLDYFSVATILHLIFP